MDFKTENLVNNIKFNVLDKGIISFLHACSIINQKPHAGRGAKRNRVKLQRNVFIT